MSAAEWLVRMVTGICTTIGLVVCVCSGLAATAWMLAKLSWLRLHRDLVMRHQEAIREAIAEWKQAHPDRWRQLEEDRDDLL